MTDAARRECLRRSLLTAWQATARAFHDLPAADLIDAAHDLPRLLEKELADDHAHH
jgi:hypothetical protein